MSITQPVDSGGGDENVQGDSVTVITEMVSWAQLMEEEQYVEVGGEEEGGTDEVDGGESSRSPERKQRIIPDEPPFKAQITNISRDQAEEDIFYYFGGDVTVKSIDVFPSKGRAEIEFRTKEGLIQAVAKDNVEFEGKTLRVFVQRNIESAGRITSRFSTDTDGQSRRRESQRGSHYNSQSSLNSDKHSRYNKDGYRDHRQFGTMPAGGFHDKRQNSSRGGHNNHYYNDGGDSRNSFKTPRNPNYPSYERQQSGPQYGNRYRGDHGGPLQRSGSYQSGRNDGYGRHGAPISSRSRTDSHSTNFDAYSRTSSRMSIDEPQKIVARKPSSNPFGDAKPVDTQTKLLELEQRELERKRIEEENRKSQSVQNLTDTSNLSEDHGKPSQVSNSDENHSKPRYSGQPRHQNQNKYHHQGGHQHQKPHHQKENLYEADNGYEYPQNDRRGSFEQGAPPGSVTIKKREPAEVDKQRDEECSTPPVDPVQYPTTIEHPTVVRKESGDKNYNSLPPQNPHHSYNKQSKNTVRPSPKTYVPPKHTPLQKSATMGQIEKVPRNDNEYRPKEGMGERKSTRGGGYKQDGTRRPSFSGSEGGRGETTKSRGSGAKRGMRGSGRGTGSTRGSGIRGGRGGGRRTDGEVRKSSDQGSETIPEAGDSKEEVHKEKVVAEEPQEKKEEPRKEVAVIDKESHAADEGKNDDSNKNSIPATQQSAQKKKDRKKEKKKEAKISHISGNKFAALLDCDQ